MLFVLLALTQCARARAPEAHACASSSVLVLGACVGPDVAGAICGPAATPRAGGCELRARCAKGEARDGSGQCILPARVRAIAEGSGLFVGDEDDVVCDGEHELAERDGKLLCLYPPTPIRACPLGAAFDERTSTCVRVKSGELVDPALWLSVVVGRSGGAGTRGICQALESASTAGGEVEVELRFPDNDMSQLELRARPSSAEATLLPFVHAARAMGGAARATEAATRVRCGPPLGKDGKPLLVGITPRAEAR